MSKHTCCKCNSLAIWKYDPSSYVDQKPIKEEDKYYCDSHIARGCNCNINPFSGDQDKDHLGRLYPCSDYLYDNRGFDKM